MIEGFMKSNRLAALAGSVLLAGGLAVSPDKPQTLVVIAIRI